MTKIRLSLPAWHIPYKSPMDQSVAEVEQKTKKLKEEIDNKTNPIKNYEKNIKELVERYGYKEIDLKLKTPKQVQDLLKVQFL